MGSLAVGAGGRAGVIHSGRVRVGREMLAAGCTGCVEGFVRAVVDTMPEQETMSTLKGLRLVEVDSVGHSIDECVSRERGGVDSE